LGNIHQKPFVFFGFFVDLDREYFPESSGARIFSHLFFQNRICYHDEISIILKDQDAHIYLDGPAYEKCQPTSQIQIMFGYDSRAIV
jgi:hypothetical protein